MSTELDTVWTKVLETIKPEVSTANYLTLFRNTTLLEVTETTATVAAPSAMVVDLLQKRYVPLIIGSLQQHTGSSFTIQFMIKPITHPEPPHDKPGPLFVATVAPPQPIAIGHLPRVRPDYTFANLAVSSSNELAYVSATTVASNIGKSYNPFFIYGPVGVGKTHIMHAIANDVYQKQPDKKIVYITSEEFTNDVVEAIRTNRTAEMKRRFRSAYLLLIDDIQFIEGKDRVQEELFHTFNILIDQGSQIILTSDRPPQEIKRLEKRLSSRFAGGLTVDIEAPDFELKTAISLIKAKKYGYDLPIEVAKLIAEKAEDARSLEGMLLRIITRATTTGEEITPDLAKKAFGAIIQEKREHLYADDVIKTICSYYNIKSTQLKGPKRDASLVKARQVTMYILKHELDLTLVEIGNILGGRDHTTVLHGVDKIDALVKNKARVSEDIMGITKSLRG